MSKPMMKCGHAANASVNGKPVCAFCIGIVSGAGEVDDRPVAKDRMAYCTYCNSSHPSSPDLPFFGLGAMHLGERDDTKDSFYCGCRGWE